jgi:hypothetical protein
MKRLPLLLGVLLLVSLLAACGGGAASTPAASPTQTVPLSTPTPTLEVITSPIVGTYSTTITQQDIASMHASRLDIGPHTWSFSGNGTYIWVQIGPNGGSDTGSYQVSQGALSITDPSWCADQFNAPMGTYSWVLKGHMLILQAKDDGCLDRKIVLTAHPLLRQGPESGVICAPVCVSVRKGTSP